MVCSYDIHPETSFLLCVDSTLVIRVILTKLQHKRDVVFLVAVVVGWLAQSDYGIVRLEAQGVITHVTLLCSLCVCVGFLQVPWSPLLPVTHK